MMPSLIDADHDAEDAVLRHARADLCRRARQMLAQADEPFVLAFTELVAAVEAGFRAEEAELERRGHAALRACRADNATILCALHRVLEWVEQGDVALGRQVVTALLEVLALRRLGAALAAPTDRVDDSKDPDDLPAAQPARTQPRAALRRRGAPVRACRARRPA